MTNNLDDVEYAYRKLQEFSLGLAIETSPMSVAGAMVAQALTIYKSMLSPEEYNRMCKTIYDTRDQVKKFEAPTLQ